MDLGRAGRETATREAAWSALAGAMLVCVTAAFSAAPLLVDSVALSNGCTSNQSDRELRLRNLSPACVEVSAEDGGGPGEICVPRTASLPCGEWKLERCDGADELRLSTQCGNTVYASRMNEDGTRKDDGWLRRLSTLPFEYPARAGVSFVLGIVFYALVISFRRAPFKRKKDA